MYTDLNISFSEGVGKKGENNCMVGSDMIAIDGSGDFSGCYFFTNQKGSGTGKMILGNVFNDEIYVERYIHFQREFAKMFEEEEQCKTCDYKSRCYQCPAGNLDATEKKMFRPDDMCQKVVKLYLDLQDDILKKQYRKKYLSTMAKESTELKETLLQIMYYMFSGKHTTNDDTGGNYQLSIDEICGAWKYVIQNKKQIDISSFKEFNLEIPCSCDVTAITIKELYEYLLEDCGLPMKKSKDIENEITHDVLVGYLVLLEFLVYNIQSRNYSGALIKELLNK